MKLKYILFLFAVVTLFSVAFYVNIEYQKAFVEKEFGTKEIKNTKAENSTINFLPPADFTKTYIWVHDTQRQECSYLVNKPTGFECEEDGEIEADSLESLNSIPEDDYSSSFGLGGNLSGDYSLDSEDEH